LSFNNEILVEDQHEKVFAPDLLSPKTDYFDANSTPENTHPNAHGLETIDETPGEYNGSSGRQSFANTVAIQEESLHPPVESNIYHKEESSVAVLNLHVNPGSAQKYQTYEARMLPSISSERGKNLFNDTTPYTAGLA